MGYDTRVTPKASCFSINFFFYYFLYLPYCLVFLFFDNFQLSMLYLFLDVHGKKGGKSKRHRSKSGGFGYSRDKFENKAKIYKPIKSKGHNKRQFSRWQRANRQWETVIVSEIMSLCQWKCVKQRRCCHKVVLIWTVLKPVQLSQME